MLVAGLWRYVYAAVIAIVPALGEAPRTRFGRWVFCALMIALSGAFVPLPVVPSLLAAIATTLVSISFLYSLARSRAFSYTPATADTNSRAASDQERRAGSAA